MLRILLATITFTLLTAMPCARAAGLEQLEANKKTVAAFEEAALNQKDFDAASKYLGPHYTQHNPNAADGPEGLKGYITFLRDKFPNSHSESKHIFADGDYVIVHDHAVREPGTRGFAIVNIYKLENGKVVEHWDVIQPIPEKAANNNGMF
jgi:predicted SnoaL-like aldol condensation-catalyzing enzyme